MTVGRDLVERLREAFERRLQAQDSLVRAMLEEGAARAAESLEGRIQRATQEAIAFAEHGLARHDATLAAFGRQLATLTREPPPPRGPAALATGDFLIGTAAPRWRDCTYLSAAEFDALPILPRGASRLVAHEVVEQVAPEALASLLAHWASRLAPEGELVVIALDGPALAADLPALRARLAEPRPLRHLPDAAGLAEALRAAGLAPQPPSRDGLRLEIRARPAPP